MLNIPTPWWTDPANYKGSEAVPSELAIHAGPQGVAVVNAYASGATQVGWGLQDSEGNPSFMPRYKKREFAPQKKHASSPFAFVMRSLAVVAIDIDGKNGGIESAATLLGNAPKTLAQTSRGGNGFHLFYTVEDTWDPETGFSRFKDVIGLTTGIDIRSIGCIYRYPHQKWHLHTVTPLPALIEQKLEYKEAQRRVAVMRVENAATDKEEQLLLHRELEENLKRPIKVGQRNNVLFAIGSQLKDSHHADWEQLISDRAEDVGLDSWEIDKLIRNIHNYGSP